jgi:hypothetical protein
VIAGSIIRVELLPNARVFDFVVAAVLLPLGIWLALTSRPAQKQKGKHVPSSHRAGRIL